MKVKKILVSQPVPAIAEKSPYYQIHAKFNVGIDYRPFIRVEGVSLKEYRSQRTEILDHTAVIFTSRTTIDHFFRICEEARVTVPEDMKYLCNTEAVALYLQKYIVYRKRKISFANGQFDNFLELILKHKSEKLLLTLAEPHKPELPDTLERLNVNFDKLILSRTVSAEVSDINLSDYDMLVFFSPAEISSLVETFGAADMPLIATFGEGTTRAAIQAGLTVNLMAPTPEAPSMAKAIELFISKVNAGKSVDLVELSDDNKAEEFIKAQQSKSSKKARANGNGVNGNAKAGTSVSETAAVKGESPARASAGSK